jgi:hypothetical protein
MVAPHHFGVTLGERGAQSEGEHQDQDYGRQTMVGIPLILALAV